MTPPRSTVLVHQWSSSELDRAVSAAGGWHEPVGPAEGFLPILEELKPRSIYLRHIEEVGFLAQHDQVEFLRMYQQPSDVSVIEGLVQLRGLVLSDGWVGELSLDALSQLEWFDVGEPGPKTKLAPLFEGVHERVRSLSLSKYSYEDLRPIAASFPNLTHLSIGQTSKLSSLGGLESIATSLRHLTLYRAPKLVTLAGIELAPQLVALDLEALKQVVELSPLASLPALQFLRGDLSRVSTVQPLAEHPSLEAICLYAKVDDKDPAPLFEIPNLGAFEGWLRNHFPEGQDLPHLNDVPDLERRYNEAIAG